MLGVIVFTGVLVLVDVGEEVPVGVSGNSEDVTVAVEVNNTVVVGVNGVRVRAGDTRRTRYKGKMNTNKIMPKTTSNTIILVPNDHAVALAINQERNAGRRTGRPQLR